MTIEPITIEARTTGVPAASSETSTGATLRNRLPNPFGAVTAQKPISSTSSSLPIAAERPAGLVFWPLIAAALWALSHSYPGIIGDASIYIGRALADLDPAGLGRDMMFAHDGQSRFSIFPLIVDHLVPVLGTARTGMLLGFLGMAAMVAAIAGFAARYVSKPFIAIVVIFVAVLPTGYGATWHFSFSEVLAVPRPFSEALVLVALAALAGGRTWLGLLCLIAASLIHPLMALAGWGVFALVLSYEDRRWGLAFGASALLLVAAGVAGVPLLHRLMVVMDPGLKALAEHRSPHLFPSLWDIGFLGPMFAEAASLVIAASFVTGRRRSILIAAILVDIGGVVAQVVLGDHFSLLLVIQAQLWRMAWLMAALGAAALAFCAIELWRRGPRRQIVLALLSLAWLMGEVPLCAGAVAAAAVAAHICEGRIKLPAPRRLAFILWGITIALGIGLNVHYLLGYGQFLAGMPADAPHGIGFLWARRYIAFPILALVLILAFTRVAPRRIDALLGIMALLLCIAAVRFWDERGPFQKMVDTAIHPPALMQIIAQRPGEVLWLDGLSEAWYLTGRPQWASPQQGASTVFSAELAHKWYARMRFLMAQGLANKAAVSSFDQPPAAADLGRLTKANVEQLCARPDAPAWIIAPLFKDTIIPPGFETHEWRLPQPNFVMTDESRFYGWQRIGAYAILACASKKPV
jgi:hypothetical protein